MFSIFLSACVLAILTVAIHAMGIVWLLRGLTRLRSVPTSVWLIRGMLLRVIWWLVVLHLAEISIWGLFYLWRGCLTDAETALYFSGSTYTTLGYGDVLLAKPWRLLGPIESLMGVLMFGLSTGYFFVVVSRIYQSRLRKSTPASASKG
jgi:ion channel